MAQAVRKFPVLWNPKVHYVTHDSLAPSLSTSHANPVHTLMPSLLKICFIITLPYTLLIPFLKFFDYVSK
jgi:hypothetical protein